MENIYDKSSDSLRYLQNFIDGTPDIAVVLGSGLGGFGRHIENCKSVSYGAIPHFLSSTVPGHSGELLFGKLNGIDIIVLSGRFHYYEGYSMKEVTFPIRVLNRLGVRNLILTNISGGLNPSYEVGDIVLLSDHINLTGDNPLMGANEDRFGPRFPEMINAYDHEWRNAAKVAAQSMRMNLHEGIYAGLHGPSLETAAEYSFLHKIGADCVGLSTVPEAIVARHMSMRLCAFSLISNQCYPPEKITSANLDHILAGVKEASPKLEKLLIETISSMQDQSF